MSQRSLAELAGMSQKIVSHYEQGTRSPSWENVMALCRALGVKCDAFEMCEAEPPDPKPRGRPKTTGNR